jgi:hypothetical protein
LSLSSTTVKANPSLFFSLGFWVSKSDPKRPHQQICRSQIDQSPKQCVFPLPSVLLARKGHTPSSRPPTSSPLVLLDSPPLRGFCWDHFQSVGPMFEVCFRGFFAVS